VGSLCGSVLEFLKVDEKQEDPGFVSKPINVKLSLFRLPRFSYDHNFYLTKNFGLEKEFENFFSASGIKL
jgi:hypothetical protein